MVGVKTNPFRDWRTFITEIAIIVVGVLIALLAQQVADSRNWDAQVRDARESMDGQLAGSMFAARERIGTADCIERQLARLDRLTDLAEVPPLNPVTKWGLRPWSTSTWESATASGAIAHMAKETRDTYSEIFDFTRKVGSLNTAEYDSASGLSTMLTHRRLEPVSRDRLQREIASARRYNKLLKLASQQWIEGAKSLHLRLADEDENDLRKSASAACPMPDDPPTQPAAG